ncbi:hypothetical protein J6590_035450 [Homalodisca vitripennis]|nr:hypothetical protein J6590_035450 [Homalodisca vitripennis]
MRSDTQIDCRERVNLLPDLRQVAVAGSAAVEHAAPPASSNYNSIIPPPTPPTALMPGGPSHHELTELKPGAGHAGGPTRLLCFTCVSRSLSTCYLNSSASPVLLGEFPHSAKP